MYVNCVCVCVCVCVCEKCHISMNGNGRLNTAPLFNISDTFLLKAQIMHNQNVKMFIISCGLKI